MGANFSRVKTWVSTEDVEFDDLNAEFDNILNNLTAANVDDFSANVSQMQSTSDPGEVGSESLPTSVAGEIARLRFMINEITGEDEWYESPVASLLSLANALGTGLQNNRLVSGRVLSTSEQPAFLVPNGAARTIKLDGTPTSFLYYINGVQYTIATDITLTNLTAAPSSNNTCLVNDTAASDQFYTKYAGEDGSEIPVDTMGSEISALTGKFAAFKLDNGSATEYFIAYVKSTTSLVKARRGFFFDSADAPIPRITYANNDTITLMKLTWVFAKTDGSLTVSYTNPVWSDDEPSSPAVGDYWFDYSANIWKKYDVASFIEANAILVGVCLQDTSNTVAARSFEFFKAYEDTNTIELFADSNAVVKSRFPGAQISAWGNVYKNDYNLHSWDMTVDLASGVTENASTYYYFYVTEDGDKIISDVKPHDRRGDLLGYYHTHQSWRCVGRAFNDGSSNLSAVESYFRSFDSKPIAVTTTANTIVRVTDKIIPMNTASAHTLLLPPAAQWRGQVLTILKTSTDLNVGTISTVLSENITEMGATATSTTLNTVGESIDIYSDGTGVIVLRRNIPAIWTSYTPTFGGIGTPTTSEWFYLRQRDSVIIRGSLTTGTISAALVTFSLPGTLTFDTAKLPTVKRGFVGQIYGNISTTNVQAPAADRGPWFLYYSTADSTTSFILGQDLDLDNDASGTFAKNETATALSNFATGTGLVVPGTAPIPVTGWKG